MYEKEQLKKQWLEKYSQFHREIDESGLPIDLDVTRFNDLGAPMFNWRALGMSLVPVTPRPRLEFDLFLYLNKASDPYSYDNRLDKLRSRIKKSGRKYVREVR